MGKGLIPIFPPLFIVTCGPSKPREAESMLPPALLIRGAWTEIFSRTVPSRHSRLHEARMPARFNLRFT